MSELPLLQTGDVFTLKMGMTVTSRVPAHFLYSNRVGDWDTTDGYVTPMPNGPFDFFAGNYVVTKTAVDGGSTGHDPYPDGHHVWAQNVDNERLVIEFYQTGCFEHMIRNVPVVGRAEAQKWSWKPIQN